MVRGAIVSGAIVSGAMVSGAMVSGAMVSGAMVSGAMVSGAMVRTLPSGCHTLIAKVLRLTVSLTALARCAKRSLSKARLALCE